MSTFKFYNPHPKGKRVGDCVKRAFTLALDKDYMDVQRYLNKVKNEINAPKYNDNRVWQHIVKKHDMEKLSFPAVKGQPRMNGQRFAKVYPKGTYLLRMAGHLVVCKDGVIHDSWDSRDKCVYNAFKVK
jgi:hypothetical protein